MKQEPKIELAIKIIDTINAYNTKNEFSTKDDVAQALVIVLNKMYENEEEE